LSDSAVAKALNPIVPPGLNRPVHWMVALTPLLREATFPGLGPVRSKNSAPPSGSSCNVLPRTLLRFTPVRFSTIIVTATESPVRRSEQLATRPPLTVGVTGVAVGGGSGGVRVGRDADPRGVRVGRAGIGVRVAGIGVRVGSMRVGVLAGRNVGARVGVRVGCTIGVRVARASIGVLVGRGGGRVGWSIGVRVARGWIGVLVGRPACVRVLVGIWLGVAVGSSRGVRVGRNWIGVRVGRSALVAVAGGGSDGLVAVG